MISEEDKRKTRGGKRVGLYVKGMKTTLVLSRKKRGVHPRLCQLPSKSDYAPIKTNFSDQVRLTCHFVIFPIGITTEDKVTSAVSSVPMQYEEGEKSVHPCMTRDGNSGIGFQRFKFQHRGNCRASEPERVDHTEKMKWVVAPNQPLGT